MRNFIGKNLIVYVKDSYNIVLHDSKKFCKGLVPYTNTNTNTITNTIPTTTTSTNTNSNSYSDINNESKNVIIENSRFVTNNFITVEIIEVIHRGKSYGIFTLDTNNCYLTFYPYSKPIESLEIEEILRCVKKVFDCLSSIITKGYLNHYDLSKFPIMSKLIGNFTKNEDYINGQFSHESYKWLYNLIHLSIYNSLIEYEDHYKNTHLSLESDRYYDLVLIRKQIYQKLDPSIRKGLQNIGVTLIQNLVCGFDTEYVNKNLKYNKLLSVQIAQQLQCYIQIPLPVRYTLCKINPVTEARYPVKFTNSFDFSLVESLIANHIEKVRYILYGNLDICYATLIDSVMKDSNLKYQVNNDKFLIKLPNSVKREIIKIIDTEGYSLNDLLTDSTELSRSDIIEYRIKIIERLKSILIYYNDELITNKSIKIKYLKDPLIKIIEAFEDNKVNFSFGDLFNDEVVSSFNQTTSKKQLGKKRNQDIKAVSRQYVYLNSLNRLNRISVSFVFNNVIVGHNTPADLSILSDFEEFKENLDIVNKCFVTLGKGFRYGIYNVVIRDTMLLAPSGQKSLANIGRLYNFEKVKLTEFEISHMDLLLAENPSKYNEYAIRDSLITLKHSI